MAPRTFEITGYVVADLTAVRPRFLRVEARRGHWVVVTDPQRADQYADTEVAHRALADYATPARMRYDDGEWRVYRLTVRSSLIPAEETSAEPPAPARRRSAAAGGSSAGRRSAGPRSAGKGAARGAPRP